MVAGMLPKPPPPPSPPEPQPSPKSSPEPKSVEGSGTSTSGIGTAVGETVLAAITLASEEDGAEGLRWIWLVILRVSISSSLLELPW